LGSATSLVLLFSSRGSDGFLLRQSTTTTTTSTCTCTCTFGLFEHSTVMRPSFTTISPQQTGRQQRQLRLFSSSSTGKDSSLNVVLNNTKQQQDVKETKLREQVINEKTKTSKSPVQEEDDKLVTLSEKEEQEAASALKDEEEEIPIDYYSAPPSSSSAASSTPSSTSTTTKKKVTTTTTSSSSSSSSSSTDSNDQCLINGDCDEGVDFLHPLSGVNGEVDHVIRNGHGVDLSSQVFHDDLYDDVYDDDDDDYFPSSLQQEQELRQEIKAKKKKKTTTTTNTHHTSADPELLETIQRYSVSTLQENIRRIIAIDNAIRWAPAFIPVMAYTLYDPTAAAFARTLDALANNNWVAVDGGTYQASIIAPAINGVVIPAIAILFANLIGTTITAMRQRQMDIRSALNQEASQLRILQVILDGFADPADRKVCRRYLIQYTTRLIAESQPTVAVDQLDYSLDTELNGVLAELNRLSYVVMGGGQALPHLQTKKAAVDDYNGGEANIILTTTTTETNPPPPPPPPPPNPMILGNAFGACHKLYEERSNRVTALRSLFPPLHFAIVTTLAISICIAFLLESNQDLLMFLNAIQLRILWTMLTGTFSALAIVCYDLSNPFRGSYQISKTVDQLYTIRLTFRASLQAEEEEAAREGIAGSSSLPSGPTSSALFL
jgi:hypothetical protein